MKKILSTLLVLVLVVALSVAGTVAYLQDKDTVTNTFTVGNVDILLDEAPVELDENGQYVADNTADRIQANTYEKLVPGQTVPKDPMVTNIGDNAAWVRVDVTLTDYAVFAEVVADGSDLTAYFGGFSAANKAIGTLVLKFKTEEQLQNVMKDPSLYVKVLLKRQL